MTQAAPARTKIPTKPHNFSTARLLVIAVDRKVVEVAGHLYVEAPKNRKYRRTIYPRRTPAGYPLAERLAARAEQARAEQAAGTNPLGLVFPSPAGKHWRSSNFSRNVLKRLPGGRMARRARQRHLDVAQPAARVLHHRPVHLEARRHRRVPHDRPRQLPHHPAAAQGLRADRMVQRIGSPTPA
jgi:hypothetical protein